MIQPTTPYMLRKDGKLLPCGDVHPYIKVIDLDDDENIDNLDDLELQWYMDNTTNEEVKKAIVDFRKTGYYDYDVFNKINTLVNNEFCKVRTSNHKYKYGGNNGEIYFRLCNTDDFNWYDVIWDIVAQEKDYVKDVTIMRDFATFGKQFDYCKIKGKPMKHVPVEEFLTMSGNPILESKESSNWVTEEDKDKYLRYFTQYLDMRDRNSSRDFGYTVEEILEYRVSNIDNLDKAKLTYALLNWIKEDGAAFRIYRNKQTGDVWVVDLYAIENTGMPAGTHRKVSNPLDIFVAGCNNFADTDFERQDFEYIDPDKYLD